MSTVYAEPSDIEDVWRDLDDRERTRSEALLRMAAVLIRRHVTPTTPDDLEVARWVSVDMVLNSLAVPIENRRMSQYSVTAGAVTESATFLNPQVSLALLDGHLDLLGVNSRAETVSYFFGGDEPCGIRRSRW